MSAPVSARGRTAHAASQASTADTVRAGRRARARRRRNVTIALALLVLGLYAFSLCAGQTFYSPAQVLDVILGERVPGASFTVGVLRLPRATLAVFAGASFGLAGVVFQTMLRNPLASPDIIGITSGASAAAVFVLMILHWSGTIVSVVAVIAGLATAVVIYLLSWRHGVAGTRLILIGLAVSMMLESVISYFMLGARAWDIQTAMRWLTGSLNGTTWGQVLPPLIAVVVGLPVLLRLAPGLELMRLGDESAVSLGVRVEWTRALVVIAAVGLCAVATASSGPIAFVAFLSGPIAARLVGPGGSLLLPSALVGATIVLLADLLGQFAFGVRYPVGVLTGVLGAPYLIYLLIRTNRTGGSL